MAPLILANNTSTPASPEPQNALQKSSERSAKSGEFALSYRERDVVDACRRVAILWAVQQMAAESKACGGTEEWLSEYKLNACDETDAVP